MILNSFVYLRKISLKPWINIFFFDKIRPFISNSLIEISNGNGQQFDSDDRQTIYFEKKIYCVNIYKNTKLPIPNCLECELNFNWNCGIMSFLFSTLKPIINVFAHNRSSSVHFNI